ncbi:MAG: hypothetical protein CBD62_01555 [Candidatus Pelagibacter sp. TMED202]|nr:MAG: hypothetical protein CBD62_01555 [Candidatus Pelagibacter sp. TMED202]
MSEQIAVSMHFGVQTHKPNYLPIVEIKLDELVVIKKHEIRHDNVLNFKLDLLDNKEHTLTVNRTGHNEKDKQILSIINLTVDEINLNKLLDMTVYKPDYPKLWLKEQQDAGHDQPKYQKGWRDFGFNGQWRMNFTTPFYTWLLKNT